LPLTVKLTAEDTEFISEPQIAHLATVLADGSPHVTPVWIDTDGEALLFNTFKGSVKHRNLVRDPRVAISIVDKANPYRKLLLRGTVSFIEDGAEEHLDRLAKKYLDVDTYPWRNPDHVRIIARVLPEKRAT
jgi:PPOX class probable F420-dependent enzyme